MDSTKHGKARGFKKYDYQLKRYLGFTLILCIGTIISILGFIVVLKNNTERLQKEFFYESNIQVAELRNNFNYYLEGMELLQRFFLSSDNVTKDEFRNFVEPLLTRQNFSTIFLIKSPNINKNIRASFYMSREEHEGHSEIRPDLSLEQYPEIIESIKTAYSTKQVSFSSLFYFIDKENGPHNIAFVYPIIRNHNVSGFVVSIIDLRKSLPVIFSPNKLREQSVYIYERHESGLQSLIYSSEKGNYFFGDGHEEGKAKPSVRKDTAFIFNDDIELLYKKWHIIKTPSNEYVAMAANWMPWTVLFFGLLLTFLVGLFLFYLVGRNIEISKEVIKRTRELANNENRLKAVMNTVLDGVVTINNKGIVQSFNPAAEKIFGYNASDVIGNNVSMLMPDPYMGSHDTYLRNYLSTGVAKIIGIGREVVALRKDKSVFPMELGISEMQVDGTSMFVGLIRDITARKEAEKQLDEERRKAEHANLAKGEFLATMSHEIRTSLNGILGMAELLSNMDLNEKEARYVNTILASGELLLVLINDVLDFSKIEAGELLLENIPVVINGLLSEVTQLLCSRATENNVELAVKCSQDIPLVVMTDPVRLRQILINLVGNAIKFTKEGHVLINVSKQFMQKNHVGLRFDIIDTGIGIEKEKIVNIFEQFSQADSSTTRRFGGTGLGLAICKKLVERMGGKIGVESNINKGSTFWVELEFEIPADFVETNIDIAFQPKNLDILIVDDYYVNLEVYSEYLKNIDIKCDTAISASIGLDKMQDKNSHGKPYDIVMIDYHMPEMDGTQMGTIIKNDSAKYGNPQLILLTALDKSEGLKRINNFGFCMHLIKPLYPNMLAEAIANVIRMKDERSEAGSLADAVVVNQIQKPSKKFSINAMVVDDFPANVEVAKEMLEKVGCVVTTAINGNEALEMLQKEPSKYDIIFMDCQMPIMDGYTATHNIRKTSWGKAMPIIAVTANTIKDAREKCLASGMDNYISKPMKISNITEMLNKYCSRNTSAA